MSWLLTELVVAVAAGLVWAVLPDSEDRTVRPGRLMLTRPGAHGAPAGLWAYLLRRWTWPGRRWVLLTVPLVLVLYIAAGLLRAVAVAVRLADLGTEYAARRADLWSDPDS